MLDEGTIDEAAEALAEKKRAAFEILSDAMAEAEAEGIDYEIVTQATLFALFTELVGTYGEAAVAEFARRLPQRIEDGEFTLDRRLQ